MQIRQLIPFFDKSVAGWANEARLLRWLTLLWLLIGLVILFSASYPVADIEQGDGLYFLKRQLIGAAIGLIAFNFLVHLPLRFILSIAHWSVLVLLGLIFLTLILGEEIAGVRRWLSIQGILIQPSELIKPFLILQSARLFGQWDRVRWQARLFWLAVFALTLAGILLQPNLSTTALCGMALWLVALAAGLPYVQLIGTALLGISVAATSISLRPYQLQRVISFRNPWIDPANNGYQLIQSLLAVGSGGTWGAGFGLSQQKLFYLPIQDTDFIFAIFAEEFGFVGGVLLLLLLIAYATLALVVALKAWNPVHRLVAIGAMTFLVGQSILHIGVSTGILPTTGLPLPFVSYGSNSIIASLMIAGLLIRVARENADTQVVTLLGRTKSRQP
ncbi:FtsW/RodA/SpoVE family cell cycle protein [Gloeocapsopsis dulcis]|uniref:Probable peptidoglycan glycosyltransferase FtsW n=1 Tax=Gloeocapsopsis dulcis AAB1 = 1H9 TaxID=1433147 RepID=A0A6N8FXZ1_9CHRO|nr:FtsW/RodA/SpoVE family cell cycle protein [Gloeocapsopsis dulcis]MUL37943.1 cell division protein FtsW [Gloeocapsopsis dulcis AAB1 = 1H9]WNN87339.1 FtsW/RodA/SpoVE family cell cycle protein [Gloeocapsopsis dulcis]